jgi:nitrite reductase/ring-hydroxylating ferredoxin subunit
MDGFTKVGVRDEFQDGKPQRATVGGLDVVVVRIGEAVYAFENSCPHQHFSLLHQGLVENCTITCPMHGWTFDLVSGKSTNGSGRLRNFAVRILEGSVWVGNVKAGKSFSLFE